MSSYTNPDTYCTPDEFLKRYDWRLVADLVSDSGDRVPESSLPSNHNLLTALRDASGDVESACLCGQRYSPEDLANLQGNASSLLKRLVADIAMQYLRDRRGFKEQNDKPNQRYERAMEKLNALRRGELIFGLVKSAKSGLTRYEYVSESDLKEMKSVGVQAERLFGIRTNRYR